MSQIDNRPPWVTLKHFRRQLLKFMVDECDYLVEELDEHVKKSKRSYKEICMRLAKAQQPGDAIHLLVSATSVMLNIPILMVYPVQTLDRNSGRISYKYNEMAPCGAMSRSNWTQYPIKLIFNGVDHYFPFINDKIGLIANLGNPAVAGLHQLCEDFKTVIDEVPENTTLKAGLNEVIQYIKAADKIAENLNFSNGTSTFTNEPATEPPEVPDASPVKTIKLRKRRKSLSDDEEQVEGDQEEGDGNEGSEAVEKGAVKDDGEPAAKKKRTKEKAKDCERLDEQCYCGKIFETLAYLDKHIQRKHKTTWMCSGANWVEGKEGKQGHWEPCREVCAKRTSLWSHFRRKHEGRYHNYCLIGDCKFGSDELWNINMHRHKKHQIPLPAEQICKKCNQGFGQISKFNAHTVTCKTDARPFECEICEETFRQRPTYLRHMRQKHKKAGESAEKHFFFCSLCGKKLRTLSGKKSHEELPHDKDGNFIKHKDRPAKKQ